MSHWWRLYLRAGQLGSLGVMGGRKSQTSSRVRKFSPPISVNNWKFSMPSFRSPHYFTLDWFCPGYLWESGSYTVRMNALRNHWEEIKEKFWSLFFTNYWNFPFWNMEIDEERAVSDILWLKNENINFQDIESITNLPLAPFDAEIRRIRGRKAFKFQCPFW